MKPAATLIDRLAFEKAFLVVCILGSNSLGAEPEGSPLTLAKALALTLEKSPALSSFSWDIRAAEARIIQAKLVPNPEISLEGEDFTRAGVKSATESMQNTLGLSQLIELGGKRKSRIREAQFDREATEWDYQVKRLEVLKLTSLAFNQCVSLTTKCAVSGGERRANRRSGTRHTQESRSWQGI